MLEPFRRSAAGSAGRAKPSVLLAIAASIVVALVALVALGIGRRALAVSGTPMTRLTQHCQPLLINWSGQFDQCFQASQVAQAEQSLPFGTLDPRPAARSVLGLSLTQETVGFPVPHGPQDNVNTPLHAQGISYIFGHIPGGQDMIPVPLPSRPSFLVVAELPAPSGPWERFDCASGIVLTGGKELKRKGPWTLEVNRPDLGVDLILTTNQGRDDLSAAASEIVGPAPSSTSQSKK